MSTRVEGATATEATEGYSAENFIAGLSRRNVIVMGADGSLGAPLAPPAHADEAALVILAKGGDQAAYAELYRRHANKAFRVVLRMTGNREDAEDVLQESVMKAFVHLNGFNGRSAFSTWLTRIAINGVLMMRRKKMNRLELPIDRSDGMGEIQIPDPTPDTIERMHVREREHRIHVAIQRLPLNLRAPLQLQLTENLQVNELASRLGLSVPATKSRLMRARARVGRSLKKSELPTSTRAHCEASSMLQ